MTNKNINKQTDAFKSSIYHLSFYSTNAVNLKNVLDYVIPFITALLRMGGTLVQSSYFLYSSLSFGKLQTLISVT